jgi:magnesium transporter
MSTEYPRADVTSSQTVPKKKRNHRGGKKKRSRRRSFAASLEDGSGMPETPQSQAANAQNAARLSFYRLQGRNLSNTSLESESLLDHRLVIVYFFPGMG